MTEENQVQEIKTDEVCRVTVHRTADGKLVVSRIQGNTGSNVEVANEDEALQVANSFIKSAIS